MTANTWHSREDFDGDRWDANGLVVDEAKHIIRGVKIIGTEAKNLGRKYPQNMLEAFKRKYEGAKVNYNHIRRGQETHNNDDRFGWIENVRSIPGRDGLFADMPYNPHHPRANFVLDYAKRNPSMLGMSPDHFFIEVDGKGAKIPRGSRYDGPRSVVEILHVQSVDLVADPSTTNGLQEAEIMEPPAGTPAPETGEMDSTDHLREHCIKMIDEALASITDTAKLRKASEKLEALATKLAAGKEEEEAEDEKDTDTAKPKNDEPEEVKKEEEALRRSTDPSVKALLRRLDAQQVQEAATRAELHAMKTEKAKKLADAEKRIKAVQRCREAIKMPKESKAVPKWATEVFLDQLVDTAETAWPALVADRLAIAGENATRTGPVSHARESFETGSFGNPPAKTEPAKPLTIDERRAKVAEFEKGLNIGRR